MFQVDGNVNRSFSICPALLALFHVLVWFLGVHVLPRSHTVQQRRSSVASDQQEDEQHGVRGTFRAETTAAPALDR